MSTLSFNRHSRSDSSTQSPQLRRETDNGKTDSMASSSSSHETVTIVLATTIPSVFLIILAAVIYHRVRRRRARFRNRGITPIDDEEIESWKIDRTNSIDAEEKLPDSPKSAITEPKRILHSHHASTSIGSVKSSSVIVYQNRVSEDQPPWSPVHGKRSVDIPPTPVLARAPNSRPGLTDETVRGDQAYVNVKRTPSSRLTKNNSPRHARTRSTRSTRSSFGSSAKREQWYSQTPEHNSPRPSADIYSKSAPSSRRATISSPANHIPRQGSRDDEVPLTGLSPRPVVLRSDIGRAIG
ncbi:hypothetical protein TARUN_8501 [Trichoderma arundinaceum]|uniref:Uncharacterized protein n=1 Tax=Trichoderma arundinaceum TaxID=490622 RepID=A0A395ND58_TRIAR|nr:hypothetical protein TARUN_8501 [Trichoderma arundinaceum]